MQEGIERMSVQDGIARMSEQDDLVYKSALSLLNRTVSEFTVAQKKFRISQLSEDKMNYLRENLNELEVSETELQAFTTDQKGQ